MIVNPDMDGYAEALIQIIGKYSEKRKKATTYWKAKEYWNSL